MKAKDWLQVIGISIATLVTVILVGYGALQLFIDTGRAIVH
jgi:hypothetical protein